MNNWISLYFDSLFTSLPLVVLALGASVNLVAGSYGYYKNPKGLYASVYMVDVFAISTLVTALLARWYTSVGESTVNGLLYVGTFESGLSAQALVLSLIAVGISMNQRLRVGSGVYEFSTLVLFSCMGLMLMRMSPHLMLIYLGRELSSQSLFVLAVLRASSGFSTEAALKYFLVGSFASIIFLAGCANIYYGTGTLSLDEAAVLKSGQGFMQAGIFGDGYTLGLGRICTGLAMKLAIAPLHWWAPDVYEGSPLASSFFMVTVPKLVLFAVLWRFMTLVAMDGTMTLYISTFIAIMAIISILVGMFGAMGQARMKRFLAFSGVNHMGFMLLGMSTLTVGSAAASRFYLELYMVVTVLMWGFLVSVYTVEHGQQGYIRRPVRYITDLTGVAGSNMIVAALVMIAMFSMAGRPPFAGFFAKFQVLREAVGAGGALVAFLAVLVSVASTFYYLRVVKMMFFDKKSIRHFQFDWFGGTIIVLAAGLLSVFMLLPDVFYGSAHLMAESLFARWG